MQSREVEDLQNALGLWVVEFSLKEGPLIRKFEKVLEDNIENVRQNLPKDYLPVGIFARREDAEKLVQRLIALTTDASLVEFRWQRIGDVLHDRLSAIKSADT